MQHRVGATVQAMYLAKQFANKLLTLKHNDQHDDDIDNRVNGSSIWTLSKEVLRACLRMKMHHRDMLGSHDLNKTNTMTVTNVWWNLQKTPNHVIVLCGRRLLSIWRSPWGIQAIIPMLAAMIVGSIHGSNWGIRDYPGNVVMAMACLGVISTLTHVRTFSLDKLVMARDTDSSVTTLAYIIAYNVTDATWLLLLPICFGVPYHLMTKLTLNPAYFVFVGIMVCWWTSGVSYVVSTLPIALHWLNIVSVFIAVIFGAFINGMHSRQSSALSSLDVLSYNRWAMEALTIKEFKFHQDEKANIVVGIYHELNICDEGNKWYDSLVKELSFANMNLGTLESSGTPRILNNTTNCDTHARNAMLTLFVIGAALRLGTYTIMMLQNSIMTERCLWRVRRAFITPVLRIMSRWMQPPMSSV